MDSFATFRRRTTDLLQSLPQSLPSLQSVGRVHTAKATWQRLSVPPVQRSSHSIDVVGGTAYIFGGEVKSREPVDNDMHAIMFPSSGAPADYYVIKPIAAKPAPAADVPVVVEPSPKEPSPKEPLAEEPREKELDDVPLASPPPAPTAAEAEASQTDKGKQPKPLPPPALGDVPPPRVGHATAVIGQRIFLFGGRGGPEMSPLDERGRVWVFDTRTNTWTFLDPEPPASTMSPVASPVGLQTPVWPLPRSYHSAVATEKPRDFHPRQPRRSESWKEWALGDSDVVGTPQRPIVGNVAAGATDEDTEGYGTFIIHGGCLAEGRTNDVWAFDVRSRVWQQLPAAPGKPRGGAALCVGRSRLYRFGGFDGAAELGGQLDFLELGVDSLDSAGVHGEVLLSTASSWQSIAQAQSAGDGDSAAAATPLAGQVNWPGPRSVAGLEVVNVGGGREYLVLVCGERAPGGAGHEAAGQFWDDVWTFQVPPQGMTAASVTDAMLQAFGRKSGEGTWSRVETRAFDDDEDYQAADEPGPRGWVATSAMRGFEENGLVLWGGLDSSNKRLGDGWILRLD